MALHAICVFTLNQHTLYTAKVSEGPIQVGLTVYPATTWRRLSEWYNGRKGLVNLLEIAGCTTRGISNEKESTNTS